METSYHLKVQSGPETGRDFSLEKAELFLGRDPASDIAIADPEVSRRHARLVLAGEHYSLEDLGSTNGTFVQGNPIHGLTILNPGDIIAIGERVVLLYEEKVFDPDATMAVPRIVQPAAEAAPVEGEPSTEQPVAPAVMPILSEAVPVPASAPQAESAAPFAPGSLPVKSVPAIPPIENVEDLEPAPSLADQMPAQPPAEKKRSPWRGIILIVVLLILIFCVIPWIIIDITNSYCLFLPGILNAIQPGVCP